MLGCHGNAIMPGGGIMPPAGGNVTMPGGGGGEKDDIIPIPGGVAGRNDGAMGMVGGSKTPGGGRNLFASSRFGLAGNGGMSAISPSPIFPICRRASTRLSRYLIKSSVFSMT